MKRTFAALLGLLMMNACAAQQATDADVLPLPPVVAGDAGMAHEAAPAVVVAAPEAASSVVTADAGAADVALYEATTADAGARPDADAQAATEATTADAGTLPEATTVDARTEGGDAARTDSGTDSGRAEGGLRPIEEVLAETFPEGCNTVPGTQMCGGVHRYPGSHVVETIPLYCYRGAWIVAGNFTCSMGCGTAGTLCKP